MRKSHPVQITWRDAHSCYPHWSEVSSIDTTDFTCQTVGFLLDAKTKPGFHVVVLSRTHEGLVGDGVAIPNENIIECIRLEPVKTKQNRKKRERQQ